MSDETNGAATSKPKPAPHPKELSPEYHKAHKQLMLWATILLIWELIGVDLSKAKDAGGNIGPIVTALKSPQAVPWALLGLVIYFLFKCSIEWGQCHLDRRRLRFARIDFISAWVVSLIAITLYLGQAISRVQFADVLQTSNTWTAILFGGYLGLATAATATFLFARYKDGKRLSPTALWLLAIVMFTSILPILGGLGKPLWLTLVAASTVFIVIFMPLSILRPWLPAREDSHW